MEKQPIDDLFSRKLHDTEVTPGADVFGRLQSRMNTTPLPQAEPKRRLAGWWYGVAAASVLVAVVWISWPTQSKIGAPVSSELAKSNATPASETTGQTEPTQPLPGTSQPMETAIAVVKTKQVEPAENKGIARKNNQLTAIQSVAPKAKPVELSLEPSPTLAKLPELQPTRESMVVKIETNTANAVEKVASGRTVVMTIAEPEPVRLAAVQPAKTDVSANAPNLGQLFEKVKQIKSGEVFARATLTPQPTEAKTGLKRLVNGVRESLRNENTLEL